MPPSAPRSGTASPTSTTTICSQTAREGKPSTVAPRATASIARLRRASPAWRALDPPRAKGLKRLAPARPFADLDAALAKQKVEIRAGRALLPHGSPGVFKDDGDRETHLWRGPGPASPASSGCARGTSPPSAPTTLPSSDAPAKTRAFYPVHPLGIATWASRLARCSTSTPRRDRRRRRAGVLLQRTAAAHAGGTARRGIRSPSNEQETEEAMKPAIAPSRNPSICSTSRARSTRWARRRVHVGSRPASTNLTPAYLPADGKPSFDENIPWPDPCVIGAMAAVTKSASRRRPTSRPCELCCRPQRPWPRP